MAVPNFQTEAVYMADGRTAAWHVPFPYSKPADVGVKVIDSEGLETVLALGADYTLQGDKVFCFVPAGKKLKVWLTVSVEEVVAGLQHAPVFPGFPAFPGAPVPPGFPPPPPPGLGRLIHEVEELKRVQEEGLAIQRARETDAQIQALKAQGQEEQDGVRSVAASAKSCAVSTIQTTAQHGVEVIEAKTHAMEESAAALKKVADCAEQKARKTLEFLSEKQNELQQEIASAGGSARDAADSAVQAALCRDQACACRSEAADSAGEARTQAQAAAGLKADTQGLKEDVEEMLASVQQTASDIDAAIVNAGSELLTPEVTAAAAAAAETAAEAAAADVAEATFDSLAARLRMFDVTLARNFFRLSDRVTKIELGLAE